MGMLTQPGALICMSLEKKPDEEYPEETLAGTRRTLHTKRPQSAIIIISKTFLLCAT